MMAQRLWMVAAVSLAACVGTVGGATGNGGASASGDAAGSGGFPACTWPSSLDVSDAGDAAPGACHAQRALVQCSLPQGVTEGCLSDDPTQCPGSMGAPCVDQCKPDEYAVACGQVGPGPIGSPPASCRDMGAIPAGIVYYCCPCGA